MNSKMKRVAVALRMAGIAGQDKLNGIFEHLSQGHRWQMSLYRTNNEFTAETVRRDLRNGVDGFIVSLPDADAALSALAKASVPTVLINTSSKAIEKRQQNLFFVDGDQSSAGREAATEFLRQGRYKSFGYVCYSQPFDWSVERGRAFKDRIEQENETVSFFNHDIPMEKWLRGLKKPCAVLASCDDDAYNVLDACRAASLRIPKDVAVLGVGNDPILCENSEPRLSSVQPDFVGEGRLAARLLERMMSDAKRKHPINVVARTHLVGIRGIVRRESTPPESYSGLMVQKAITFINRKALSGIEVDDVARHLRISRSLLDKRFRKHLGASVYDMIIRIRLDEAERRLRTTDDRIGQIAVACGWKTPNALKNLFKRKYGLSMREWRKRCRDVVENCELAQ